MRHAQGRITPRNSKYTAHLFSVRLEHAVEGQKNIYTYVVLTRQKNDRTCLRSNDPILSFLYTCWQQILMFDAPSHLSIHLYISYHEPSYISTPPRNFLTPAASKECRSPGLCAKSPSPSIPFPPLYLSNIKSGCGSSTLFLLSSSVFFRGLQGRGMDGNGSEGELARVPLRERSLWWWLAGEEEKGFGI